MLYPIFSDIQRFRIAVFLSRGEADFQTLKAKFTMTDGNLSFHLKKLESEGIIVMQKWFEGKRPRTRLMITDTGRNQLLEHLDMLEMIIREAREE